MIKFLQSGNKATKYLLAGLLVILCGSMVTYLIPGFMGSAGVTQEGVVAKVGGVEISTQDIQKYVDLLMQQASRQGQNFGDAMRPPMIRRAIPQLIADEELRFEAERMGLEVSDKEVTDALHAGQFAEMFFPKGQWIGQDKYEQIVRLEFGLPVDEFERQFRFDLQRRKVITSVTAGVTVTPAEVERAYKDQNTKVKFDYAVLNLDDLEKQIKPTDAELKAYFDANQSRYQNSIPEKRQVRYFLLTDQLAQSKIIVSPTDLEQYYRLHDEEYRVPDRVKIRQIQINLPSPGADGKVDQKAVDAAQAKAADLLKQVKAGVDFAELARKNSEDPGSKENGGEMGWIIKGQTAPAFESAAFSMNKGQTSGVVSTGDSFHIVQTEENETAHKQSLAEVKDSIESILKQQKAAAWLDKTANTAADDARKQGLEQAAARYGSLVLTTSPVARTDALAGVGNAPEVMSTIFSTDEKAGVQSVRTPQGFAVFQVMKIIPPATPPFEAVKDRVSADFKAERSSSLLSRKVVELSDRARSIHDLRKAAKETGATVKSSELVDRSSQVPDIGALSGQAGVAFSMKPGDISGPLSLGRKGVVLAITERQEPSLTGDEFAKAKDALIDQLTQEKVQEATELFINNLDERLKKEGKVKTNENVLEGLLKNGRS
ncbi:MAG TPA: peptidyl-prolyl cis-trans isomerase [Candidatus Angelobacter sp.]